MSILSFRSFQDLLAKYRNVKAELDIAYRHKLSKKIIKTLCLEKQETLCKINKLKFFNKLNRARIQCTLTDSSITLTKNP
jgi:hypothetical protein